MNFKAVCQIQRGDHNQFIIYLHNILLKEHYLIYGKYGKEVKMVRWHRYNRKYAHYANNVIFNGAICSHAQNTEKLIIVEKNVLYIKNCCRKMLGLCNSLDGLCVYCYLIRWANCYKKKYVEKICPVKSQLTINETHGNVIKQ